MTDEELRDLLARATKGPWGWNTVGEVGIRSDADDQTWGMVVDIIAECRWPNVADNARLIALAPDLAAEVLRLRDALRPFAEALQGNYFHQPDNLKISMGSGKDDLRWVLPLGDFRRARTALQPREADE
jgi:hypothetical protein